MTKLLTKAIRVDMKYLHNIKGSWAVRIAVKPDLQAEVGNKELRRWLGRDKKVAERKAPAVIAEFLDIIDGASARKEAKRPSINEMARDLFDYEVIAITKENLAGSSFETSEMFARRNKQHVSNLRLTASGEASEECGEATIGWAVDRALVNGGYATDVNRAELRRALAAIQLEIIGRRDAIESGKDFAPKPSAKWHEPDEGDDAAGLRSEKPRRTGGQPISQLLGLFHQERRAGRGSLSEKTIKEQRVGVRMLEEVLGQSVAANSITKLDMIRFKAVLMNTPANYRQRFPGKTIEEAGELNKQLAKPYKTLDASTINKKWMTHLSSLFQWCEDNGYTSINPAKGVRVSEGRGNVEPSRVPFSLEDLKRLFATDIFDDPRKYGTKQWVLLLALYTGARSSSELARINVGGVYQDQDIWLIYFEEASKNTRSKRVVPVHPKLIELGFLGFVEGIRRRGGDKIFPDWQPEDKINRWFLRTYKKQVGISDGRKVLHSFRHTLKTALAQYGTNRDISDLILGHQDQSAGGIYIADATFTMLKSMHEALSKVEFDINLPRKIGSR